MKSFVLFAAALVFGLTLTVSDAEAAKRFGGGKSTGMQREAVQPPPAAAPMAAKPAPAAAAPAAQPKRSWMGPLAGLAAGLGLAALAAHFGFGEELATMLLIGLMALAVLMVIGFIMRKRTAPPAAAGMQYAAAGAGYGQTAPSMPEYVPGSAGAAGQASGYAGNIPAHFDVESFVRHAKVNFIRLQAANDAGNLEDIREFTTPEMFAEIKMNIVERGGVPQQTDVVSLEAEVIDVAEEAQRYVVSVRFHGLIREDAAASAEAFDEIWHMTKPVDGSRGWVVAGIQQRQ